MDHHLDSPRGRPVELSERQLQQILEKAILSPSGDNCQPWSFEWAKPTLKIFYDSARAKHPLNPQGVASVLALGCLLESIELAASELNVKVEWKLGTLSERTTEAWVELRFFPTTQSPNELAKMLTERCTDRRFFRGGDLKPEMFPRLELASARLHVLPTPNSSWELFNFIAESEELLFEFPELISATLEWVRFSRTQAQESGDGLSWRNLGLKPWELPVAAVIRKAPGSLPFVRAVMQASHHMRVLRQLRSSAGLVCVSIPMGDRQQIVDAGRLMMKAWLSLTRQGHGVQPMTLSSTICTSVCQEWTEMPEKWTQFFHEGDRLLRQQFALPARHAPIWMIRTGRSTPLPPKLKTFRRPLSSVLLIK